MKRNILIFMFIICACLCAYGQNASPIDLILLLNTSSEMSSSYDNVSEYLTGGFLSEFLRLGDTFHLIAFSGTPRLDAARRVSEIGDVETIIGRILLQYPVENGNNIGAALLFAEQYITTLPSRPKKIVLVSTASSDIDNLVGASRQRLSSGNASLDYVQVNPGQPLSNLPHSQRESSQREGASSSANQVTTGSTPPASSTTQTQTTPPASSATQTPPAQQQTGTAPAQSQEQTPASTPSSQTQTSTPSSQTQTDTSTPSTQTQTGASTTPSQQGSVGTGAASTTEVSANDQAAQSGEETVSGTDSPSIVTTEGVPSASDTGLSGGERETEQKTVSSSRQKSGSSGFSVPFAALIVILLLAILGIIIFVSRKFSSNSNRVIAEKVAPASTGITNNKFPSAARSENVKQNTPVQSGQRTPPADHSKDLAQYAAVQSKQRTNPYADRYAKSTGDKTPVINPDGPLLLNLFVEDQSTNIGKRNIHSLKSGYSLTVGGGSSDFLIFLVPVPPNIGEIRRNGSQCTFVPKKPKYFPELGSNELRDCINKTIRVISDKKYELRIRFEMYEDPLIALNRMLMSIKVPG